MCVDLGAVYKMLHFTCTSTWTRKVTAASECNTQYLGAFSLKNFSWKSRLFEDSNLHKDKKKLYIYIHSKIVKVIKKIVKCFVSVYKKCDIPT